MQYDIKMDNSAVFHVREDLSIFSERVDIEKEKLNISDIESVKITGYEFDNDKRDSHISVTSDSRGEILVKESVDIDGRNITVVDRFEKSLPEEIYEKVHDRYSDTLADLTPSFDKIDVSNFREIANGQLDSIKERDAKIENALSFADKNDSFFKDTILSEAGFTDIKDSDIARSIVIDEFTFGDTKEVVATFIDSYEQDGHKISIECDNDTLNSISHKFEVGDRETNLTFSSI